VKATIERIPYEPRGATWLVKVDGKVVATTLEEKWARTIVEKLNVR
jgi:hypothetical protein